MKLLPDPLHPALVHFPIVLILLGMLLAVVAVFWRKGYVPAFAAALLTLGAVGTWVAMETGETDGGLVENSSAQAESLLDAHETWAKRTMAAAATAAVIAVGAVALFRFPRAARGVAVAAALAAGVASWTVYETGHRGGALVYQHGAGVTMVGATSSVQNSTGGKATSRSQHEDRD